MDSTPVPLSEIDTRMVSPAAEQLIKEIGIPPCPAVLAEFMAESNREEPDFRRLSHLINKDVALAASVLKTINSPLYGLARKARTVQDALALLGLRETSRLIAGLLLRRAFASSQSPAMYDFWDTSARTAMIAAYLARELGVAPLEEAHTFALFRDSGVPVLLVRFPDYEELLVTTRNESELGRSHVERARYGFDHAQVGSTLAQSWHLPPDLCHAIRIHTTYDEPAFSLCVRPEAGRLMVLAMLAEQLHRIHRGSYDSSLWAMEETFIADMLGPVHERLDALAGDIGRLLEQ